MANVIDELFVTLGLDSTQFDAAQKQSLADLRKFEDQSNKTSKNAQMDADKMADRFGKVKTALLGLATAAVGINGFKDFVNVAIGGNAALDRQSKMLGMSSQELKTWGSVVEKTGGSLESFEGSIKGMKSAMSAFERMGDTSLITPLAQLGALDAVDIKDKTVDLYKLSDALVRFKTSHGMAGALSIGAQIGLDEGTVQTLLKGSEAVKALHDQMFPLYKDMNKNAESATKLNDKWIELKTNGENLLQSLVKLADPVLSKGLDWLNHGLENNHKKAHEAAFGDDYDATYDLKSGQRALSQSHTGAINFSPTATGLPRNMRNHNPGNIEYGKFARDHGAIGSDGRFAVFPDDATGSSAQSALIANKIHSGSDTLSKLIESWSPSKENGAANTNAYIAEVSSKTGIDKDSTLTDTQIGAIAKAQASHEGWLGAKVNAPSNNNSSSTQSEVNIQHVNVNAPNATDAYGVANGMRDALMQNSLINAGTRGST